MLYPTKAVSGKAFYKAFFARAARPTKKCFVKRLTRYAAKGRRALRLLVRAFLAVRQRADTLLALVGLMRETLPCFKPQTLANLADRLRLGVPASEAAKYMAGVIASAFSTKGAVCTYIYDRYQRWENGVAM
jgi:hypothetical protein